MAWSAAAPHRAANRTRRSPRSRHLRATTPPGGLFPLPPGGRRAASGLGFEHRPADRRADLPRRLPVTACRDDGRLASAAAFVVQDAGGLGDHLRFLWPRMPAQRLPGQWQAGSQVMGERDHPLRGPPGHREGDGGLIGAELVPPGRFPAPGRRFLRVGGGRRAASSATAASRPAAAHPSVFATRPAPRSARHHPRFWWPSAGRRRRPALGQGRPRRTGVERVPGAEPRPGPALLPRHRVPGQEPRIQARVQARRRARIHRRDRRIIRPRLLKSSARPPVTPLAAIREMAQLA